MRAAAEAACVARRLTVTTLRIVNCDSFLSTNSFSIAIVLYSLRDSSWDIIENKTHYSHSSLTVKLIMKADQYSDST
jgi:hypothetical protein